MRHQNIGSERTKNLSYVTLPDQIRMGENYLWKFTSWCSKLEGRWEKALTTKVYGIKVADMTHDNKLHVLQELVEFFY